ncbi:MAG TPA: hypothetical protein VFY26_03280 [Anaerolineales bacterium]|nr:hypothetical protein [Anaerolineales bacterium]
MQKQQSLALRFFPALNLLLGLIAIFLLLQVRKEGGALFGYSPVRLALILAEAAALILFALLSIRILKREETSRRFADRLAALPFSNQTSLAVVIFLLLLGAGFVWIALTRRWDQLGPLGGSIQRTLPFLIWPGSLPLQLFLFHNAMRGTRWGAGAVLSLFVTNLCAVFLLLDTLLRTRGLGTRSIRSLAVERILPDLSWALVLLAIVLMVSRAAARRPGLRSETFVLSRNTLAVFLTVLFIYMASALVVQNYGTGAQAYSPDLAAALLQGHAYLENPASTVDLTYTDGRWFVPYPPLVAILMMPPVALFGAENINTVQFSIFFAALNAALVFVILEKLRQRGWTKARLPASLWLTALFSLGTVHWYLAIWGEVWPLNQLTATTFVALAVLATLSDGPAWLAGLSLGAAMLARPHVGLMTYPLLFGMYWHSLSPRSFSMQKRDLLKWLFASGLALAAAVLVIFWYNNLRFGSPFDFGYDVSQINIGLFVDELRTYGQFNIHYIGRNIQVMFLRLPRWDPSCGFFSADEIGMSIFITTPALVYVFGARRMNPLSLGAWAAVGLFLLVLLLHYSTGALQFGYRFLLDFLIPVMVLLALALPDGKLSLTQKILILAGILVNYWGLWWMFRHWCR